MEGKPNDCAKIIVAIVIFLAPNLFGAKIAPYLLCIILNSIRVASDVTRTGSTSFFSSLNSLRIFLESDGSFVASEKDSEKNPKKCVKFYREIFDFI